MNDGVHWLIPTLAGVILGALVPYLIKVLIFFVRRFRRFFLEGEWYSYYFVYEDSKPVLKHETWKVKKGIVNKITVIAKPISPSPDSFPRRYRGKLTKEQNLFTVTLWPDTHTEEILIRFKGTYNYDQKVLLGLWSGIDLDGYACVGPQIIARHELSDTEIEATAKRVQVEQNQRLMKIS